MDTKYPQKNRLQNNYEDLRNLKPTGANPPDDSTSAPTYALAVARPDNIWRVTRLSADAWENFACFDKDIRSIRTEGVNFGILNRACEYFIIVRPGPKGTKLFVSDLDAALDDNFVIDALEERGYDTEMGEDWEGSWGIGDFSILEDIGLPESVLSVIVDDDESWADDQIMEIAETLGFDEELEQAVDY